MEQLIDTSAANADAGNVAASEGIAAPTTEVATGVTTPGETITNTPAESAKEPDVTSTQAFSKRLNEKIAETEKSLWSKVNPVIAKLGGVRPDGKPIETFEDLQAAIDYRALQEEAEKEQIPVEYLSRLTQAEKKAAEVESKLSAYERKEIIESEAKTLATDEKWGEFFKTNESEIRKVADQVKCDLGTAKLIVYDRVGPTKVDEDAIANKAIQEFIDKKRTLNKPTEGSGATPVTVAQTPTTFAEARAGARAYLDSLKEQT